MRILITGGFGYIGGRLAQYIHSLGHQVILGTRSKTSPPSWLSQADIFQIDWDDDSVLDRLCCEVDVVIHAAGVNAANCIKNPVMALEFNGTSTARLLQSAIGQGVKRFIYLSTAHVYQTPLIGVINESSCASSLHPYASSHRAGEDAVRFENQQNNIEGIVVRISNACGAPAHKDVDCWGLIINDLCRQAIVDRKLKLKTSGIQYRNFIPIADVNSAIAHLLTMSSSYVGEGLFNLGGDSSVKIIDIADMVAERCENQLGFRPEISHPIASPEEVSSKLEYDINRLLNTGLSLNASIDDEIDQTLAFCQSECGKLA